MKNNEEMRKAPKERKSLANRRQKEKKGLVSKKNIKLSANSTDMVFVKS